MLFCSCCKCGNTNVDTKCKIKTITGSSSFPKCWSNRCCLSSGTEWTRLYPLTSRKHIATSNNNQKAGSRIQNQCVRLIPLPRNEVEVSQLLELKPASVQNTKLPEKSSLSSSVIAASPLQGKDINPVLLMKHLLGLKSLTSQAFSPKCSGTIFGVFAFLAECSHLGRSVSQFTLACCSHFTGIWKSQQELTAASKPYVVASVAQLCDSCYN